MPKRILSEDSESDDAENVPATPAPARNKRTRTASAKQKERDEQQKEKELSELERLRRELKNTKKKLAQQKKAKSPAPIDEEEDDDRLPPESEDESENNGDITSLQASLRKRQTTAPPSGPPARIRHRVGDPSASPTPQRRPALAARLSDGSQVPEPAAPRASSRVHSERSTPTANNSRAASESAVNPVNPDPLSPSPASASHTQMQAVLPQREGPSGDAASRPSSTQPALTRTGGSSDSGSTFEAPPTSPSLHLRPAPFRNGQQPNNSRASPQDYIDEVKSLLTDAIGFFSCYLFTVHAFPSTARQRELGMRAWQAACATRDTLVLYELSERMIRAIVSRKSTARGDISDNIRPAIVEAYGFRRTATPASERHNASLATALVQDGAFHHKEYDVHTGKKSKFSEHSFIVRALQIAFFGNVRNAAGFVHKDLFDPIPDEALALIHTVIHAHICEWSTGTLIKEEFSEAKNASFYAGFLKDIQTYGGGQNATAWANIRKRMYVKAFRAGGGLTLQVHTAQMSTAAMEAASAELAGRTGLTDSEDENEAECGSESATA